MEDLIVKYYDVWIYFLQWLGGSPGVFTRGYQIANIVIFVFLQPGLALLFFLLWRKARNRNRQISNEIAND